MLIRGQAAGHTFELRNDGNEPLVIDRVKSDCSCAVTELRLGDEKEDPYDYGEPIPPGATLRLEATLDTAEKVDQTRNLLTILSNDPGGPTFIELTADVQPPLRIEPDVLAFGTIPVGWGAAGEMRVTSRLLGDFKLELDRAGLPDELSITLGPEDPDGHGRSGAWTVQVALGVETPLGIDRLYQLRFFVTREGVHEDIAARMEGRRVEMPASVRATVTPVVYADPPVLSLGTLPPGGTAKRPLAIVSHERGFELEVEDGDIQLQDTSDSLALASSTSVQIVGQIGPRADLEVEVGPFPEDRSGPFRGVLRIRTDHPEAGVVEVPVFGMIIDPDIEHDHDHDHDHDHE